MSSLPLTTPPAGDGAAPPADERLARRAEDAFVLCDPTGIVLSWSTAVVHLFGWSADEAAGQSLPALLAPAGQASALAAALREANDGRPRQHGMFATAARHHDGRLMQIECLLLPVAIGGRRCCGVLAHTLRQRRHDADPLPAQPGSPRDAIVITDADGRIRFWNRGAEALFGHPAADALGRIGNELLQAQYPLDPCALLRELRRRGEWEGEVAFTLRDGARRTLPARLELDPGTKDGDAGGPRIVMSCAALPTALLPMKPAGRPEPSGAQPYRFDAMFDLHPDGVFAFEAGSLCFVNPALATLTGFTTAELMTGSLSRLVAPEHLDEARDRFAKALRGAPQNFETVCRRKDGSRFEAAVTMLPQLSAHGVRGLHGIVKDISGRKEDERRIRHLATHDALTGLPNRNLLHDRMQHAIGQARRRHAQAGVLFMDLNRFKVINDSLGHDRSDILLCRIAERLKSAVREIDTVARLGGAEFVVLLENLAAPEQLATVARTLLKLVREPVDLGGHVLSVSTSIGGSVYPDDGDDVGTLLKNADLAMYDAKATGAGQYRRYQPEMNARAVARRTRETSPRLAVDRGELVMHYQPRLDIARNEIVAVEALVRWDHPDKGLMMPSHFIGLAEETGLIDAIGEWVLGMACRQLKCWQNAGLSPIRMSVNISSIQLRSDATVDVIARALG
ncbi:MAG: sensor domain-containing protein, partial [Burkholderiaceae bacterium]